MTNRRSIVRKARWAVSLALAVGGLAGTAEAAREPAIERVDAIRAALLSTPALKQPFGTEPNNEYDQIVQWNNWGNFWNNWPNWGNLWRNW